jgi:hypothetical protein
MRILKDTPLWDDAIKAFPVVFSVKNYGYFYTLEAFQAIPFINQQPSFNATTQYLEVRLIETVQGVRQEWFVSELPVEE